MQKKRATHVVVGQPQIAVDVASRAFALIERILRRFCCHPRLPVRRLSVSVPLIITFSLVGCRHMEDRTGEETLYLYQIQPVTARTDDATIPSGIRKPLNLDTYQIHLCPTMTPTPADLESQCPAVNAYTASISDPSGATRNRLKAVLVTHSDLICSQTEAQIVGTNDLINFSLTQTTTVLAGAGALVTGLTSAKILSGLAAISNATRSNVNAVFYENAVKAAIIQKMNDMRAAKLTNINSLSVNNGSAVPLSKYSTEEMLGDVQAYHDMCSFYAGVNGLTSTTTKPSTGGGDSSPPAPTIKSVSSKDGDITVTWDAPTASSVVIISYTATATNSDAAKKEKPLVAASTGAETSVDIPHCTPDETYTVAVVATNGAGAGPPSKPSNPVKCVASVALPPAAGPNFPPPTILSVKSSANKLNISLKAPANPKTAVSSYSVSAINVDVSQKETPLSGKLVTAATTIDISGCVTGHSYKVTAVANYAGGVSKPAAAAAPVLCVGASP